MSLLEITGALALIVMALLAVVYVLWVHGEIKKLAMKSDDLQSRLIEFDLAHWKRHRMTENRIKEVQADCLAKIDRQGLAILDQKARTTRVVKVVKQNRGQLDDVDSELMEIQDALKGKQDRRKAGKVLG